MHPDPNYLPSTTDFFLITLLSGLIAAFWSTPFWVLNTRVFTCQDPSKSLYAIVKEIYKNEGLFAFYKGLLPNLILVINPIINFVIYETLK